MNRVFDRLRRLTFWQAVFVLVVAGGLYSTVVRFGTGLGGSTALSDAFPWGLWIGFDILCGVALAAGGFTISAVVYIFHLERFRPIVRPAILTAFLGYLLVIFALLFDLGRPWAIWHALVLWNPSSVMFEVAWCVMLYTTVLALEFSPMLLERLGLRRALGTVKSLMVPLVILGVILSMLHQSSLGSLYLIVPHKMHPLWYSPLLPVLFFLSAVSLGCAMTIFESFLSYRAFRKRLELDILSDLGKVMVVCLLLYLVVRLLDLAQTGTLALVAESSYEGRMFLAEVLLGVAAPAVLLAVRRVREDRFGLFLGAVLVVLGFLFNRLNVSITAFERSAGSLYTPALTEIFVTGMFVALGFFLFAMAVKYLPVFPKEEEPAGGVSLGVPAGSPPASVPEPHRLKLRRLALGSCVVVVGVTLGFALDGLRSRDFAIAGDGSPRSPGSGERQRLDAASLPEIRFSFQEDSPAVAVFRHRAHVNEDEPDCSTCHAAYRRLFHGPALSADEIADLDFHSEDLCGSCHDGEKSFGAETTTCARCHEPGEEKEAEESEETRDSEEPEGETNP